MAAPHSAADPAVQSGAVTASDIEGPVSREEQKPRYAIVDIARGVAIVAMIAFHFTWDLDYFALIPSGLLTAPWFIDLGHAIAAAFLAIVGVSLALAARTGDRTAYSRRVATIGAAALAITVATRVVFPSEYIFFGILHCIAVSSLAAAPFLRAPIKAVAAAAGIAIVLPLVAANPAFNAAAVQWIGLGTREPVTNDWAPFLPGFGIVLFGLAGARLALVRGLPGGMAAWRPRLWPSKLLASGGRRSLLVYLAHQPLLLGLLFAATALAGRSPPSEAQAFVRNCSSQCVARGAASQYCERACGCVAEDAKPTSLWKDVLDNRLTAMERESFNAIALQCMRKVNPGF